MAVVDEAYTAFNSGDVEKWVAMREAGSFFASEQDRQETAEWYAGVVQSQIEAGAQFTEIECASHGEGKWPGVADDGAPIAEGHYITCDTVLTPDTVLGGGPVVFDWVIADDAVVAVKSDP